MSRKQKYLSEQLQDAVFEITRKASTMPLDKLRKELAHVQQLSETNCGWAEYAVRVVCMDILSHRINGLVHDAQKQAARAAQQPPAQG
jgi:hypothetical protein